MDLYPPKTPPVLEPVLQPAGAVDENRRVLRLPVNGLVLYLEGRTFLGRGDLSTGGARWTGPGLPLPQMRGGVVLGVRLPGMAAEMCVPGQVYSVRPSGEWTEVRVRFTALAPALQQAIQRSVDDWFVVADASGLLAL